MLLQHPITNALYKIEQTFETQNIIYQQPITHQNNNEILNTFNITTGNYLPGQGLVFLINNLPLEKQYLFLGSKEFLENKKIAIDYEELNCMGCVDIYMGIKYQNEIIILAIFILRDSIRDDAYTLFKVLNEKYHTILLTGDKKQNALWLQNQLNIKEIYYEIKPEQKANIIKQYQKNHHVVMIGDGINDTIALKQADVGISFAEASKLALYSSEILLLNYHLELVEFILNFSKTIIKKIKQNLFISFLYNALLLPLAFIGMINPFIGSIFMSLSSITVVSNSLSLLKYKREN